MGGQDDGYIDLTSDEPGAVREETDRTLRSRLADMARDRGRVRVDVLRASFAGSICGLGPDCVSIETIGGRVDIHVVPTVPIQIEPLEGGADTGQDLSVERATFQENLRGWADSGAEISVGVTFDDEPLFGTIEIGDDYVGVVSRLGRQVYVTLGAVAFVTARDV